MGLRAALWLLIVAASGLDGVATLQKVQRVPSVMCDETDNGRSLHNFVVQDIWKNKNVSLSDYRGKQEPGANATEILNGIKHVRPGGNFVPNFHMFAKVEVNGENEHPLFTYLKSQCPSTRDGHSAKEELWYKPLRNSDIRWNFEKILVGKDGQPYKRYDPSTNPLDIRADIQTLLRQSYHDYLGDEIATSDKSLAAPTSPTVSLLLPLLLSTAILYHSSK